MAELDGAHIAILGLGASGRAAARLALHEGAQVYVSDQSAQPTASARAADDLRAEGADVAWGGHDLSRVARADLVVVSPGIPPRAPVLQELRRRGVPWISEPELAVRFFTGPLIAITGTNGKTTTTLMTAHLLDEAGFTAAAGGNVGGGLAPTASELALLEPAPEWYVLELSSFQLGAVETLDPDIGVLLNLAPDHLDHYEGSVEAYYADKARLFDHATDDSDWVLPAGDEAVEGLVEDVPGRRHRFGVAGEGSALTGDDAGELRALLDGDSLTLDGARLLEGEELPLLGLHNRLNALAAALTARLAGATPDALARGLRTARPLPHRLAPVRERAGVLWVNDSKATNVAATRSALESLDRPVILLAGGKDKGEDFGRLLQALDGVRTVLAYGAAGTRLAGALEESGTTVRLMGDDFAAVVRAAEATAHAGDLVLLSPACSSFDMFEDYEDRGRRFEALVRELPA